MDVSGRRVQSTGNAAHRAPSSGSFRLPTPIPALQWNADRTAVRIVDQTRLPNAFVERDLRTPDEAIEAIQTLAVRGAPAIGVCAAMALALHAQALRDLPPAAFHDEMDRAGRALASARPTAVNLMWAVARVVGVLDRNETPTQAATAMTAEANAILDEDRAMSRAIGEHGATLLEPGMRILTHCNAGALVSSGIGTALAPVYVATERGMPLSVLADETRPLMQGARLTAWELQRVGVPVSVLADHMAATVMQRGEVDLVIVGADRIAANGDVANKIGTYALAIAARHHRIPFHVAAPSSTIDFATAHGSDIVIEQRSREEIARPWGHVLVPDGVPVINPAFDVTPAALVTSIITERGIHHPSELATHHSL